MNDKLNTLISRLNRLGIKIELIINYPWIYLNSVNGNKVKEKYYGNHGYTIAFLKKDGINLTDISHLFKTIRLYL